MIAPAPKRRRRTFPALIIGKVSFVSVPDAQFIAGWAPVVALAAARIAAKAATTTVLLAALALTGCGHHHDAAPQQQPEQVGAPAIGPATAPVAPSAAG